MDAQKQLGAVREAIFVEAGHAFADEEEKGAQNMYLHSLRV
jgi:hypothetical protein